MTEATSILTRAEGEGAHKALFATGHRICAKTLVFPRRISTHLLVYVHFALNRMNDLIDEILDRLALRQRLRRFIRSGSIAAKG